MAGDSDKYFLLLFSAVNGDPFKMLYEGFIRR